LTLERRLKYRRGNYRKGFKAVGRIPERPRLAKFRLPWRRIWAMDQGLTFLLAILILVIFVVMPLSGLGVLGKFIVDLVLSLLLVSAPWPQAVAGCSPS